MFAGLPATGIGGIFYMLLVFFMPFRELWRAMKGESSIDRWIFIASRWALFAIVISMMYTQALIMKWMMGDDMTKFMTAGVNAATGTESRSVFGSALYLSLLSLAGVMGLVYLVRFVLFVRGVMSDRPQA